MFMMFDTNFHEWKIIPLFLIEKYFRKKKKIKYHGSLDIAPIPYKKIPEFYIETLLNKFLSYDPSVSLTILSLI